MHQVLQGDSLPVQWERFPLKTKLEMMAGRNNLRRVLAEDSKGNLPPEWRWMDEGQVFLTEKFDGNGLEFTTSFISPGTVELIVWRRHETSYHLHRLFTVHEAVKYFVSEATLAKIIMVM